MSVTAYSLFLLPLIHMSSDKFTNLSFEQSDLGLGASGNVSRQVISVIGIQQEIVYEFIDKNINMNNWPFYKVFPFCSIRIYLRGKYTH